MAIIIGIVLFMILILIHELGHFIAAKKSGVKVLEFGIGIPPKAFKLFTDKSGTEYTVNWIPLGGFVRLKGEAPENEQEFNAPDSFMGVSLGKKLIILLAGITMNIVFAWILFTIIFTVGIVPMQILPKNALSIESHSYLLPTEDFLQEKGFIEGQEEAIPVEVLGIAEKSLAEKNGILSGDILLQVNGENVDSTNIGTLLQKNIGKTFDMQIQRNNETINKSITCPSDGCLLGIIHSQGGTARIKTIKFDIITAMGVSVIEMKEQTVITYNLLGILLGNLFSGNKDKIKSSMDKMSGPIGAVKVGEIILENFGILHYISFAAMISLALGIFNILPIPALDGGRTFSILIQSLFKLKPEKYFTIENYINYFFFILLMGFGIYVMLLDLHRFWNVSIPLIG